MAAVRGRALVRGVMEQLALLGIALSFSGRAKPLRRRKCRQLVKDPDSIYDSSQFPEPGWAVLEVGRSVLAGWESIAAGSWPALRAFAGGRNRQIGSEKLGVGCGR